MMVGVIDFLYLAAFIPTLLFFVLYVRSRWRSTLPGRASMALTVALLLVLALGLWRQLTGDLAPEWMRILAFATVAGALWFQVILLMVVQHRSSADPRRCWTNHPARRSTDRVEHERLEDHAERR